MKDTKAFEELLANSRGCVNHFRDEYKFLSNFYTDPRLVIKDYEGNEFKSAEAMFQSYKTTDPKERAKFAKMGPKEAKAAGRKVKLRPDWEEIKCEVMFYVVYQKFSQNAFLARKLLETSGMRLVEGNTWGDKFWGAIPTKVPTNDTEATVLAGENHLGQILMKVRRIQLDQSIPLYMKDDHHDGPDWDIPRKNLSISPSVTWMIDRRPFEDYLLIKMNLVKAMTKPGDLTIDYEAMVGRKTAN